MRILPAGLLAMSLLAMLEPSSSAQEGLRGPGPAIGGFHLIAQPGVQKELGLNEAQLARTQGVADRMNARFQQDMGKMKGLTIEEQMKRSITLAGPHYEEGMRQIKAFLTPSQVDRFDQILFQQRGPMAMLEPKIAQTLQLQNEQAQRVAELVARSMNEQNAASKAAGSDRQAAAVQVKAIADRASAEANGLLSPEQQRIWARLTGEPFRLEAGGPAQKPNQATPKQ